MNKKRLVILAAVAAFLVLLLLVVPYLVNADNYRSTIEAELSSSAGRKVQIGHLHFSLLSRSLSAEEISIADDEAFSYSPFLRAQSLEVGVDVLPLIFSRTLHVNALTIDKPDLILLRSSAGRWNFSSLGGPEKPGKVRGASAAESGSAISGISVSELKINDGRLTLGNASGGGNRQSLEAVDLKAENISQSSAFPLKFSAKSVGGGKLALEGTAGPLPASGTMEHVPVHLKLDSHSLPGEDIQGFLQFFGVSLPAGASLRGGTVNAKLDAEGALDRLVSTGPVSVSKVTLSGFNLVSKLGALASMGGAGGSSETLIKEMSSKVHVAPEAIRLDDLTIDVPSLGTLTGSGTISASNELNFRMVAKLNSGSPLAGLQSVAGLGKSGEGVPFRIRGTTSNPNFVPDFGGGLGKNVPVPSQGLGKVLEGLTKKKKP